MSVRPANVFRLNQKIRPEESGPEQAVPSFAGVVLERRHWPVAGLDPRATPDAVMTGVSWVGSLTGCWPFG